MSAIHPWLSLDTGEVVASIAERMREAVSTVLMRRGTVIAISGGIDSAVCAALAARALGKERVYGLLLPEKDSSETSVRLGRAVCERLGIAYEIQDISSALEAIGCYRRQDAAIRSLFPEFGEGWKCKIAIAKDLLDSDRFNFFTLVVEDPNGRRGEQRLPHKTYLEIVAATNFKQRIRKTLEYFHADRLHYAVLGTPNRLEYDQGFFVKNGDGSADIKPIAHLYKSQVYALGRHLGIPQEICEAPPTTDTYSLYQGQDEFYFVLPYDKMDIVLFGLNGGRTAEEIKAATGLSIEQVERVIRDIRRKRSTTAPLHRAPVLLEDVPEVRH